MSYGSCSGVAADLRSQLEHLLLIRADGASLCAQRPRAATPFYVMSDQLTQHLVLHLKSSIERQREHIQ